MFPCSPVGYIKKLIGQNCWHVCSIKANKKKNKSIKYLRTVSFSYVSPICKQHDTSKAFFSTPTVIGRSQPDRILAIPFATTSICIQNQPKLLSFQKRCQITTEKNKKETKSGAVRVEVWMRCNNEWTRVGWPKTMRTANERTFLIIKDYFLNDGQNIEDWQRKSFFEKKSYYRTVVSFRPFYWTNCVPVMHRAGREMVRPGTQLPKENEWFFFFPQKTS